MSDFRDKVFEASDAKPYDATKDQEVDVTPGLGGLFGNSKVATRYAQFPDGKVYPIQVRINTGLRGLFNKAAAQGRDFVSFGEEQIPWEDYMADGGQMPTRRVPYSDFLEYQKTGQLPKRY